MADAIDYAPPPTVEAFIQSEKFYNFIVGPVGSGKTTGIIMKILYHAMRQRPSPRDKVRRTRWVVVRNTAPMLRDTTLKSFFQWFRPGVAGDWAATDKVFTFRFGDVECEVMFRPLDTPDDVGKVLSLEVTGAILDEFVEIDKDIVEGLASRCGRYPAAMDGGPTWFGMWGASNPGNEDQWWYNWLYEDWEPVPGEADGGKSRMLGYFEQPSGFSPKAENLANLPGGRRYYDNQTIGKTEEWIKQFIEVRWGYSLRGKPVYPTFNPDLHISQRPLSYNPHLPLLIGFDAGLTPAAILGQEDMYGRMLVLGEVVAENMGAQRFCRELLRPYLARRFPPDVDLSVWGDPAIRQRAQTDERSVGEVLAKELGVKIHTPNSNRLPDRIGAVEERLSRLTELGPAYLLDPSCKVLARGFTSGYRYALSAKGEVAPSPDKNKYSHPHDANQYLCMGASRATATAERRRRKAFVTAPRRNPYVY